MHAGPLGIPVHHISNENRLLVLLTHNQPLATFYGELGGLLSHQRSRFCGFCWLLCYWKDLVNPSSGYETPSANLPDQNLLEQRCLRVEPDSCGSSRSYRLSLSLWSLPRHGSARRTPQQHLLLLVPVVVR